MNYYECLLQYYIKHNDSKTTFYQGVMFQTALQRKGASIFSFLFFFLFFSFFLRFNKQKG